MLPSSLKVKDKKVKDYSKYLVYVVLAKPIEEINEYIENNKRSKKQIEILKDLIENKRVLKNTYSSPALKTLLDNKLIKQEKEQIYRINVKEVQEKDKSNRIK